jgi:predicted NAD/FAD-binding protein
MGSRIAIIGSGISGLGAAWALHRAHEVTVYEARDRIGGHSHTVDVRLGGAIIPVDTGFIVYNEVTYPHLTRLFRHLGVPTEPSDMSFSFSVDGGVEYGASLRGLLAQPFRLGDSRYRAMLRDIARFRRTGVDLMSEAGDLSITELLEAHGFSRGFVEDYVLPMLGAIWSARRRDIRRFPAASMLRFLANHGLIEIFGRPRWRTVSGGSREYVRRLSRPFARRIKLRSPVTAVERSIEGVAVTTPGGTESFDHAIFATHTDQALRILGAQATPLEHQLLGSIRYEPNRVYLHSDNRLMPRRRAAWSSWNSIAHRADTEDRAASVTYWMNRLQNLDKASPLFVSLNPIRLPDPDLVHGTYQYSHPQFDAAAVAAQRRLPEIQGRHRTWYAGAYSGYGFHEDGLQSGFNVAAALGCPPPWHDDVVPMSSAQHAKPPVRA